MMPAAASAFAAFMPIETCWVCGGRALVPFHQASFDFQQFEHEDPELFGYTGQRVWMMRCGSCGFGQPAALPALPAYFDRMYRQRWSEEWVAQEFESTYKDLIFRRILRALSRRRRDGVSRSLLDVGAHVGRFLLLAQRDGWDVEGIELNPRTAAYANARTGAVVHLVNAHALARGGRTFGAITLTDVLEHIPEPLQLLTSLRSLLQPAGSIAVKVPNGHAQWAKERVLAAATSHRISLAENLIHVNQFSPQSLRLALERAGFVDIRISAAAPELPAIDLAKWRTVGSRVSRLCVFAAAAVPGAVHTPLALNLQAYATKPS
jgi:2-polyprenyl-3-methyl-5-hydroxy-6-metoxy-1,4-benzoquinol methylase